MSSTGNSFIDEAVFELRQNKQSSYAQPLICTVQAMIDALSSLSGNFIDFDNQFGGNPNGMNDNTPQFNTATAYQATFKNPIPSLTGSHAPAVPPIIMSTGNYLFLTSPNPITYFGFGLYGQGEQSTVMSCSGNVILISIGVFSATPANYFGNDVGQNYQISDLTMVNTATQTAGARVGMGLQDNGSGGCRIYNVKSIGFYIGFCFSYGADFITMINSVSELCDYGFYFGPGTEQVSLFGQGNFGSCFTCTVGIYIELCNSIDVFNFSFVNNGFTGLTNHNGAQVQINNPAALSTTLIGVTVLASGYTLQRQINLWSPWMESDSAGLGFQPLYFISFTGNASADAPRGLNVVSPYIIGGGAVVAGSAFIGSNMSGGTAFQPRLITITDAYYTGTQFSAWFTAVSQLKFRDLNTRNGQTLLPLRITGDTTSGLIDETSYQTTTGAPPTTGYYVRGTMVKNGLASVTATEVQFGWVRITDGTAVQANVNGVDWSPMNAIIA